MLKLVGRHGDYSGENGGLLTLEGIEQARQLGLELHAKHGVNPASAEAAVSEAPRTGHTAETAGFVNIIKTPILNEVNWKAIPGIWEMLKQGIVPDEALEAAQQILNNPPAETVWFTHGFVIAGLCELQGVRQDEQVIPNLGEVRSIPL